MVDIPGAVNLSIERESDQNIFYADNKAYFTTNSKSSVSLELEIAEIAKDIMLQYLGYVKSKNGTVLETNTAVTPSFALMFQIETDEKARKVCYYNCKAIESAMDYVETYNYFSVIMDKIGKDSGNFFWGKNEIICGRWLFTVYDRASFCKQRSCGGNF